jgi:hypothetical protein
VPALARNVILDGEDISLNYSRFYTNATTVRVEELDAGGFRPGMAP